jgi:hypothetical protein
MHFERIKGEEEAVYDTETRGKVQFKVKQSDGAGESLRKST